MFEIEKMARGFMERNWRYHTDARYRILFWNFENVPELEEGSSKVPSSPLPPPEKGLTDNIRRIAAGSLNLSDDSYHLIKCWEHLVLSWWLPNHLWRRLLVLKLAKNTEFLSTVISISKSVYEKFVLHISCKQRIFLKE